jgi:gamma-glutamyltranspeptidase/glutathione hydrolase
MQAPYSYSAPYAVHRGPVFASNMVATSQPLAAQAGLAALAQGGNAVDAALASAITLTVVEPTANGVGSDAFAIVWDGKQLHGLNASGRAPASWTPQHFAGHNGMPYGGWDSVTVPGAVSAWATLSARFGRLPFADLFKAAIGYARDGFAVTPHIAGLWAAGGPTLMDQPGFAELFLPRGRPPHIGERWSSPHLAETLQDIAETRGETFYRGRLAALIAATASEQGGALTEADLAAHRDDWSGTISQRFRGVELHEIPPNGQGIAALMALGMLEHTEIDTLPADSAAAMHLQIEAMKLAFADVARYVADPDFMEFDAEVLLAPAYLKSRAALIDRNAAGLPGAGAPRTGGTVYVSTADASGMMVSYIQSNFCGFGSGVVIPGTGMHFHNRGWGFSLEAGHPNLVGPGKRPFHTIIPGFLMKDGAPLMSFGVMGGPMQAQGQVQMVIRTQCHGQNPQAAIDAPRWRVTSERKVAVEWSMPDEIVEGLAALGHQITRERPDSSFGFGGAQAISVAETGYVGGSDHRKDGQALGF